MSCCTSPCREFCVRDDRGPVALRGRARQHALPGGRSSFWGGLIAPPDTARPGDAVVEFLQSSAISGITAAVKGSPTHELGVEAGRAHDLHAQRDEISA
jgi:hypothetical protein